jgi:hypothetical protein
MQDHIHADPGEAIILPSQATTAFGHSNAAPDLLRRLFTLLRPAWTDGSSLQHIGKRTAPEGFHPMDRQ